MSDERRTVDDLVTEAIDGDGVPAGGRLSPEAARRAADLQLTHALLTHALDPEGMAEERAARLDVLMRRLRDASVEADSPEVVARIGWGAGIRRHMPQIAAAACLLLALGGMLFFFSSSEPAVASEAFQRAERVSVEPTDRQYRLRFRTRVPGSNVTIERASELEMRGDDQFVYRGRFDDTLITVIGSGGTVTVMEDDRVVKTVPDRSAARLWLRLRFMPMPFFTMRGALTEFRDAFDLAPATTQGQDASVELLEGTRRGGSRLEPQLASVWIARSTGVVQRLRMRWSASQLDRFDEMRARLETLDQCPMGRQRGPGDRGQRGDDGSQMLRQLQALGRPIGLEMELIAQEDRPADYYTPDGQRRRSGGL